MNSDPGELSRFREVLERIEHRQVAVEKEIENLQQQLHRLRGRSGEKRSDPSSGTTSSTHLAY